MSQVEVLLPRDSLSAACELRKSPHRGTSYVVETGEPPGGLVGNEEHKQPTDDSKSATVNNGQQSKKSVSFNGDAKEQQPRKRRNRRGRKRKWRPYNKLTWDERRELQERESRRAEKVRAEMCACGITLAPYNTTQFLMEDHNLQEPDYDHIPINNHRHRENSNSNDSSDEFYSSPEDEEDFLQQQFTETYKDMHAERLSSMTKSELVQELMSVEDRVEVLQKRLDEATSSKPSESASSTKECNFEEQLEKIRVFREEISKLTAENERLRRENDELRMRSTSHAVSDI